MFDVYGLVFMWLIVVDDVMIIGSMVVEIVEILCCVGVEEVCVWVCVCVL